MDGAVPLMSRLSARIGGVGLDLIALGGGNVSLGFLLAGVRSEPRGSVSGLARMSVAPGFRRCGAGSALHEHSLAWHRSSGRPSASLAAAPANRAAIAFCQKAGFIGTTLVMERASSARTHNLEA